jgi:hypothetical protein
LVEDLVTSNPHDRDLTRLKAMGQARLANVLRVAGRFKEAVPNFRVALDDMQTLEALRSRSP